MGERILAIGTQKKRPQMQQDDILGFWADLYDVINVHLIRSYGKG